MITERLKQFIDFINVSISAFEKSIGMSNASFRKIYNNNGAIGSDKLERILNTYPQLNPSWLLTGEGSMILGEENAVQQKQESTESKGDFVRVKIHDDHVHYTYINRNHVYAVREEADRITVYMTNGDNYTIFEDFKRVLSDLLR
jgi:hypothetical protein|nr:MAG TPA: helix-turn-helix domain protein [Caudoviricetes sp.]